MTMTMTRLQGAARRESAPLFLTPRETADTLGVTLRELREMRERGTGPTFTKLGENTLRYWRVKVLEHRDRTKTTK